LRDGVDDDQQFKHTTPPAYASATILLHSAEFIRLGEYHCFGTAIALFKNGSYTLQLTKETFHGNSGT
jgi:hypothetical protein